MDTSDNYLNVVDLHVIQTVIHFCHSFYAVHKAYFSKWQQYLTDIHITQEWVIAGSCIYK